MIRGIPGLARSLAALVLFGVSFGYVEAAVVAYLRIIYDPVHRKLHPDRPTAELFPVIRLDELEAELPDARRRIGIEMVRELATILMLASVGLALGRNPSQVFAAFVIAFGVWDIAYYAFLWGLIGWPESILTWDLLFLLPVPWTGPVIAPMLVAASMILAGAVVLAEEFRGRPIRFSILDRSAIILGGLLVVLAFCWDYRNIVSGGLPNPFNWPLFAMGEGVGLTGFLRAFAARRS